MRAVLPVCCQRRKDRGFAAEQRAELSRAAMQIAQRERGGARSLSAPRTLLLFEEGCSPDPLKKERAPSSHAFYVLPCKPQVESHELLSFVTSLCSHLRLGVGARSVFPRCMLRGAHLTLGVGRPSLMTQRTLDTFLGRAAKRAKTATASPVPRAGPPAEEATAEAPAAAAASSPASPSALSPEQKAALQAAELQELRALGAANQALAKRVVIAAEACGGVPPLADLLVETSWREAMAAELRAPYFSELERFVQGEWGGSSPVFPPKDAVFRALNGCPPSRVRVVILGQDPYHDLGQATGLSFSVPPVRSVVGRVSSRAGPRGQAALLANSQHTIPRALRRARRCPHRCATCSRS